MRTIASTILLLPIALVGGYAFAEGNAELGKAKSAVCAACHKVNGVSVLDVWPNLAGQKSAYLVKQLNDFKTDARKDPVMGPVAKLLSDADIANLAAYYSRLAPSPAQDLAAAAQTHLPQAPIAKPSE